MTKRARFYTLTNNFILTNQGALYEQTTPHHRRTRQLFRGRHSDSGRRRIQHRKPDEPRRANLSRRPCLSFLTNPCKRPPPAARFPARRRTIGQNLGIHTRRARRLRHAISAARFCHLSFRPAPTRTRGQQHHRRQRARIAQRPVLV